MLADEAVSDPNHGQTEKPDDSPSSYDSEPLCHDLIGARQLLSLIHVQAVD